MWKKLLSFTFICFFITVAAHPAIAHPGAAIVVDAKGRVYFVAPVMACGRSMPQESSLISVARRFTG